MVPADDGYYPYINHFFTNKGKCFLISASHCIITNDIFALCGGRNIILFMQTFHFLASEKKGTKMDGNPICLFSHHPSILWDNKINWPHYIGPIRSFHK
jgi:hypothetical protein